MNTVLRALDNNGNEFFYTGRAGEGWVSKNRTEAFPVTLEYGRTLATRFNKYSEIHGLRFIALNPENEA